MTSGQFSFYCVYNDPCTKDIYRPYVAGPKTFKAHAQRPKIETVNQSLK